MVDMDNIERAKELLWSYCEKCKQHGEDGCAREQGLCEIDEAWGYLDAANIEE